MFDHTAIIQIAVYWSGKIFFRVKYRPVICGLISSKMYSSYLQNLLFSQIDPQGSMRTYSRMNLLFLMKCRNSIIHHGTWHPESALCHALNSFKIKLHNLLNSSSHDLSFYLCSSTNLCIAMPPAHSCLHCSSFHEAWHPDTHSMIIVVSNCSIILSSSSTNSLTPTLPLSINDCQNCAVSHYISFTRC